MRPSQTKKHAKKRGRAFPKGRQTEPGAVEEIRNLLAELPRRRDLLIEYLHLIQDAHGHLSERHLAALAEEMGLALAEVFETATFYAHFHVAKDGEPPPPVTVRVCDGVACRLSGAESLRKDLAQALDGKARVARTPCAGACDTAPLAVVGRLQVAGATVQSVCQKVEAGETEPAVPPIGEHAYGSLRRCLDGGLERGDVISSVEAAELRGMGGAGFPQASKLRLMLEEPKPRLMAINADEGEPGAFKDRHCLKTDPHRVLEGALIAAWVVEAEDVYIYLRDEYAHIREILLSEIPKAEAATDGWDVRIHLRRGAGAYICGEETALMESIEGKRGLPRNRPPYPSQAGLFGRPTLINNVETLYWFGHIVEKGAQWFVEAGRPRLYSVSGRINDPGVKQAPAGTPVNRLIKDYCCGMADGHAFKAYLPGGASGGILPASLGDLPLDFGSLESQGCFVGSAAVVVLSDHDSIPDVVRGLMEFFADESCGQCTPCRIGTEKLLMMAERGHWDAALIGELSEAMGDASICGLGHSAPNPLVSALRFFPEEFK